MKREGRAQPVFDLKVFLTKADSARIKMDCGENKVIFSQGDSADSVFYIDKGKVKLTVLSKQGKEAVIAILGTGDFFGEGVWRDGRCAWRLLSPCPLAPS